MNKQTEQPESNKTIINKTNLKVEMRKFTIVRSIALFVATTMLLSACGGSGKTGPEANKHKLEELLREQSKIAVEIAQLEEEVAKEAQKNDTTSPAKSKAVKVLALSTSVFKHYIDIQGSVESDNVVLVNPKMPGIIDKVYVKEGDRVAKGQLLATMDADVMKTGIAELNTQLDLAKTLYNKQKALWDQKIGTEVSYLNAKTQKEGLERRLASLNTQIGQNRIVAPMAGTIDKVIAREGEAAMAGMGSFRIVNMGDLKIVAKVSENYLMHLKVGNAAKVILPSEGSKEFDGKISYVSGVVDPTSRTVDVEIRVPGANKYLKPNLLTKVKINDQTLTNAIVIDQNIVQTSESGQVVFVAKQEPDKTVAQQRKVSIGLSYNGQVQILSGLAAGEKLVTQGYQELTDGQLIAE